MILSSDSQNCAHKTIEFCAGFHTDFCNNDFIVTANLNTTLTLKTVSLKVNSVTE